MQAKNHDGSYGKPMPFDSDNMDRLLTRPEVAHVEVFEGTPEELTKREKYRNNLRVKKSTYKGGKSRK